MLSEFVRLAISFLSAISTWFVMVELERRRSRSIHAAGPEHSTTAL